MIVFIRGRKVRKFAELLHRPTSRPVLCVALNFWYLYFPFSSDGAAERAALRHRAKAESFWPNLRGLNRCGHHPQGRTPSLILQTDRSPSRANGWQTSSSITIRCDVLPRREEDAVLASLNTRFGPTYSSHPSCRSFEEFAAVPGMLDAAAVCFRVRRYYIP